MHIGVLFLLDFFYVISVSVCVTTCVYEICNQLMKCFKNDDIRGYHSMAYQCT